MRASGVVAPDYYHSELEVLRMPSKQSYRDLTGLRFGRYTVIRIGQRAKGKLYWLCRCDCGNEKSVVAYSLTHGVSQSCGCLHREAARKRATKHGYAPNGHPNSTYNIWCSMIGRCTNPRDEAYFRYGGRGIFVCERWRRFENFLADMGERPEKRSLDRIDNSKGYSSANCRWATAKEQANNRRRRKWGTVPSAEMPFGCRGVSYDKTKRKWRAYITLNGKQKFIGRFNTEEEAKDAFIKTKLARSLDAVIEAIGG